MAKDRFPAQMCVWCCAVKDSDTERQRQRDSEKESDTRQAASVQVGQVGLGEDKGLRKTSWQGRDARKKDPRDTLGPL